MIQEIEKLKAELVAAQCRIDELELQIRDIEDRVSCAVDQYVLSTKPYSVGKYHAFKILADQINEVTGN